MPVLLLASLALLAALAVERIRLERTRSAVRLRIAVTGTRGKTTVTRVLASVLREDGRTVLAKTTGSEPCLVLPDGSVERIRRRGPASILEQKRLLHRAVRLGADALVAEVMSIHAENHAVEGRRILVPHLVLATNFFADHTEAQGDAPEDVGAVLALAVPAGAVVLAPRGACPASFRGAVAGAGATLVEVPPGTAAAVEPAPALLTFSENLDLVVAAAQRLGVGDDAIRRGIANARHDVGALAVWAVPAAQQAERPAPARSPDAGSARAWLVNAFAANDPAATVRVYDEVQRRLGIEDVGWVVTATPDGGATPARSGPERALRVVGLLNLRADRGDRTLQWADALAGGLVERFDALLVTGLHAAALARKVHAGSARSTPARAPHIRTLPRASAAELTRIALAELGPSGGVVFGFGNIGGPGVELVEHWERLGTHARVHSEGSAGEATSHGH